MFCNKTATDPHSTVDISVGIDYMIKMIKMIEMTYEHQPSIDCCFRMRKTFKIIWNCLYCEHPPTCCPNVNKPKKVVTCWKIKALRRFSIGRDTSKAFKIMNKWSRWYLLVSFSRHIEMSSLQMKENNKNNQWRKEVEKKNPSNWWLNMVAIFICTFVHFIVSQTSARSRTKWRLENALQFVKQQRRRKKREIADVCSMNISGQHFVGVNDCNERKKRRIEWQSLVSLKTEQTEWTAIKYWKKKIKCDL